MESLLIFDAEGHYLAGSLFCNINMIVLKCKALSKHLKAHTMINSSSQASAKGRLR